MSERERIGLRKVGGCSFRNNREREEEVLIITVQFSNNCAIEEREKDGESFILNFPSEWKISRNIEQCSRSEESFARLIGTDGS